MFSLIAAFRSLVLPFGALTGQRIILDGVNGRISIFNVTNTETIRMDAATSSIIAYGSNGATAALTSNAVEGLLSLSPPSGLVNPTTNGDLMGAFFGSGGSTRPALTLDSPVDSTVGAAGVATVTVAGRTAADPQSAIDLHADVITLSGAYQGKSAFATTLCNNNTTVSGVDTDIPGASFTFTTVNANIRVQVTATMWVTCSAWSVFGDVVGKCNVDGGVLPGMIVVPIYSTGDKSSASFTWTAVLGAAGSHTIKLVGGHIGGTFTAIANATHTGISMNVVDQL